MKIVSKLFLTGITAATVFLASCDKEDDPGNDNNNTAPNSTDLNFLTQASYANHNEILLSQLALTKASNDSVKMFAQMLIDDHTAAQTALDSLGTSYSQTLPNQADSAHTAIKMQLDSLMGNSFDSAFIAQQVTDHQNAINLFQNEIDNGNAPAIKAYANNNLPKLQSHKQTADSLSSHFQ